jgi:choline dehydrogenase-like flavoprotein
MLCEIVFLCNERLNEANRLSFEGPEARPVAAIKKYQRPDLAQLTDDLKWRLLRALGAQPLDPKVTIDPAQDEAGWKAALAAGEGMPGAVAHEVGSLRMRVPAKPETPVRAAEPERPGLVDEDLRYLGTPNNNVYVCDLSVFPTTPAANPSLTAVALAIRLAEHLRKELKP